MSKRYAQALFELAFEQNKLSETEADLLKIEEILSSSDILRKSLSNPAVSKAGLASAIKAVFTKSGVGELVIRFCEVLGINRRLVLLPDIYSAFLELLSQHRGEITAEVASAAKLGESYKAKIKSGLEKSSGRKVNLKHVVKKELLGGLVIQVGSKMLDTSVNGQLERMKLYLKSARD